MTWVFRDEDDKMNIDGDADWAKGPARKSASGGMTVVGGTVEQHWSRTRVSRVVCGGVAMLVHGHGDARAGTAIVVAGSGAECRGSIRICTASNAARAIASRRRGTSS